MTAALADLIRNTPPVFLNVGVREFGDSLREAGYDVVYVQWAPPAGGDQKVVDLLDDLL
jgi:hypothetical protein